MDSEYSWDEWLPEVACSFNSAINSIIKESPHSMRFGQDKRPPSNFLYSAPRCVYNMDDFVRCRLSEVQSTYRLIYDRLTASQHEML